MSHINDAPVTIELRNDDVTYEVILAQEGVCGVVLRRLSATRIN